VLIDTATDFREQAIAHRLDRIDAVLFTHAHADHVFGLDDLRRFNTLQDNQSIPAYAAPETLAEIQRVFRYLFGPRQPGLYRAKIDLHAVDAPFRIGPLGGPATAASPVATPVHVVHDDGRTVGYRIDYAGRSIGYAPDCVAIPDASIACFRGVDVMIIDALRYRAHLTHMHIDASLETLARIAPGRAFMTHIGHDIDHAELTPRLPAGVSLAYDGLALRL
jgi:phosphoribosyl 1,2-cyclic phosphate phosphodiesterase